MINAAPNPSSTGGLPAHCRIGTSGFHYKHWKGIFYPENLPSKQWFGYYAAQYDTVEINNTFYRLPPEAYFDGWRTGAPDRFCFAVKFSRYGSHVMKLKNAADTIRRFTERAKRLEDHLGPILVQLPPKWDVNVERLREFLEAAPRNYRWTVEFRDPRWLTTEVYDVLRRSGAALCIHDMIPDHPHEITADWVYMRFHGGRYDGNYSDDALALRATEIIGYLKSGLDVYAYFNNDLHGHALQNAATLKNLVLGQHEEKKAKFSKPAV
jgi:uncharacterized protein YecE (DUF72 family)